MLRTKPKLRNRRGATLAVVAVSLVALLGVMALAIDLGMMYAARNEAQRVADAAALAGASAFMDYHPVQTAQVPARTRATEYVRANYVLSDYVVMADEPEDSEAEIDVDLNRQRVTVTVRREQIPTWFARILGIDRVAVTAVAAAEAVDAGGAKCVVPWAVQDMWLKDGERPPYGGGDKYNPADPDQEPSDCRGFPGDCYNPARTLGDASASGYGRTHDDNGHPITLKTQKPVGGGDTELAQPGPGEFMIWQMPTDPALENCSKANDGGGTTSPMYQYKNSICGCNRNTIELGVEYPIKTGNTAGPTAEGLEALVPNRTPAQWDRWDDFGSDGPPTSHPQVVKIALMAPLPPPPDGKPNYTHSNLNTVTFTNFALVFVEAFLCGNHPQGKCTGNPADDVSIQGRFLYNAAGEAAGEQTGSLVKHLRLVR